MDFPNFDEPIVDLATALTVIIESSAMDGNVERLYGDETSLLFLN